jgi:hypothetical protein
VFNKATSKAKKEKSSVLHNLRYGEGRKICEFNGIIGMGAEEKPCVLNEIPNTAILVPILCFQLSNPT